MKISAKSPTAQRIGRIAAVGAVALLLAGAAATPAEARPRSEAVLMANNAIGYCFGAGGEPHVTEMANSFEFTCVADGWEFDNVFGHDGSDD